MGVARKKLRQAEKKVYAMTYGRYLSGSEVGPGVRRAIRDLDDVRVKRAEQETARMEARRKAERDAAMRKVADSLPAKKTRTAKPKAGAKTAKVEV